MILIYNISVSLYTFLIRLSAPFNQKAKQWITGRKRQFEKIKAALVNSQKKKVWFHCASLGEFEQGRPVIEKFKEKHPDFDIVLTFYSPSGYEIRKNYAGADYIFYLPRDSKVNAKKFIELVKPEMAVFVKYEFWYHFVNQLNKQGIPVYVISCIFRQNQIFFRWYGGWFRKMLTNIEQLFVQDDDSAKQLEEIGLTNCAISGDTRFDRVIEIASNVKTFPELKEFAQNKPVLIAGSTWPADEDILIQYINNYKGDLKMIIAPHEIHEDHIVDIQKKHKKPCIRFTQAKDKNLTDYDVMIIDTMGMLSSMYQYGHVAYIGGGFGVGIHNTLEAATFGLPVLFGPNYQKFKEARDLVEKGGAFSHFSFEEFKSNFETLKKDQNALEKAGKTSAEYVRDNRGATEIFLNYLEKANGK